VKSVYYVSWFADELRELHNLSTRENSATRFTIRIYESNGSRGNQGGVSLSEMKITGNRTPPMTGDPWEIALGRPNLVSLFGEIKGECRGLDAAVNACGPASLLHQARRACVRSSDRDGLFYMEEEAFEL
jgi:hypothetical protein